MCDLAANTSVALIKHCVPAPFGVNTVCDKACPLANPGLTLTTRENRQPMRLGVYQSEAGTADFGARLSALDRALHLTDVDMVVCPELWATGYFRPEPHRRLAQPRDGKWSERVATLARRHDTAILFGYPEAAGGGVYNSAIAIGPDGTVLAHHRKCLPAPGSFEEEGFDPGSGETLFDFQGLRIALVICYEVEFPETARRAALAGADLLVAPTALVDAWPVVAEKVIPARAFENGMWVAYANHAGREMDRTYFGGSRIVRPDGTEAAVAGRDPALIVAGVDHDSVQRARTRLPYLQDLAKLTGAVR